ncbi:hypothetical protein ACFQZC_00895 [Streptacidiphilus monticola]
MARRQRPQRGFVRSDDRADDRDLQPFRRRDGQQVSCSRWSLGWLHQAAARLGRP